MGNEIQKISAPELPADVEPNFVQNGNDNVVIPNIGGTVNVGVQQDPAADARDALFRRNSLHSSRH